MGKWIAAAALVLAVSGSAMAQDSPAPVRKDGVMDGVGRGAGIGALAVLPFAFAQMSSCDKGCDWPSTPGLLLAWGILGAAAGSAIGLAADLDAPDRLSARVGGGYRSMTLRESALSGSASTPTFMAAVRLSRHISVHVEYARAGTRFLAAPGAVRDDVLNNLVTQVPESRPAGFTHGIESRRVDFILTELVGFHPPPLGRVRLELLAGIGVQGEEERAYYDAYRQVAPGVTEPVPGKYYVLDFESPEEGVVFGVDADVTLARGLSVVPTFRYHVFGASSSSIAYGAGVHWRF